MRRRLPPVAVPVATSARLLHPQMSACPTRKCPPVLPVDFRLQYPQIAGSRSRAGLERVCTVQQMVIRRTQQMVTDRAAESPVLLLQGPRAVGKTTLLRDVAARHGATVVDLDDLDTRKAAAADPALFVSGTAPVCIDEYQHVPALLDAIKAELNRDGSPGRFILTGSTRHEALGEAQALTGRLHRITLHPLSQGERAGTTETFLETAFAGAGQLTSAGASTTTRSTYVDAVVTGGFPLAIAHTTPAARTRWIDDYVKLTLQRDVKTLSKIRQAAALPRLLTRLAGQTAQVLNVKAAGEAVGLKSDTAEHYTQLLEDVFLIHRLPAWGTTIRAKSVSSPKLHLFDSGVAARLLQLSAAKLATLDPSSLHQFGHLLETFVVNEILKQASWSELVSHTGYWRTHDGAEVDLIVEADDGRVVAIEVKAAGQVPGKEFTHLKALRDALKGRFVAGFVLYIGTRSYRHDDRLYTLPIDRLWTTPA